MAAKFEIRSPKPGEYNWVLLSQGRTLATGESYKTRASAEKAVASMRAAVGTATVVDLTLPPAKSPAARTTGGPVGRAVATTGRAVAQVAKAAGQALTEATEAAAVIQQATEAADRATKKAKAAPKRSKAAPKKSKAKAKKSKGKKTGR